MQVVIAGTGSKGNDRRTGFRRRLRFFSGVEMFSARSRDGESLGEMKKIADAISRRPGYWAKTANWRKNYAGGHPLPAKTKGPGITVEVQDAAEKVLIETGPGPPSYILTATGGQPGTKSELMDAVEPSKQTGNANIRIPLRQDVHCLTSKGITSTGCSRGFSQAHQEGDLHIHDLDFWEYPTCIQIPLGKLLQEGFDNGHGYIRPPKRPASAAALAAIILQSSQNDMHGGQSFAFFDKDMAPFVKGASEDEVYQAMEALIYNLNSMHSRAGAQVPFSSINLGTDTSPEGRMITRALLLAHERGLGRGETPIFPNIIFRVKKGVNLDPDDPNYDLFQLAIRTASRRLNPTFSFMDSTFKPGDEVSHTGCRTRYCQPPRPGDLHRPRQLLLHHGEPAPLGDPGQRGT